MEWGIASTSEMQTQHQPRNVPTLINISITPYSLGHPVILEYRANNGAVQSAHALPAPADPSSKTRQFQAVLPNGARSNVEHNPVLLLNGKPISPRLGINTQATIHSNTAQRGLMAAGFNANSSAAMPSDASAFRWGWSANFLGSLKARLRKELVGPTPNGLRINWHVIEGNFVGADFQARILPGATDWMRILPNGIGFVDVKATFGTNDGSIIYGTYSGVFDLGPEGFKKALDNDPDPNPPVVVTPIYETAAPKLAWLNRLQCIGVGRVDMQALEVSFDVYRIAVGDRCSTDS